MKYSHSDTNINGRLLKILILPSWLSAGIALIISIGLCIGTIYTTHFKSSEIKLQLLNDSTLHSAKYQVLSNSILSNSFIGNLPLLIFWTLVGTIVYLFASNIISAIRSTTDLTDELNYVHANRHKLLWTAAEHLLFRLLVLGVWILYIAFFFNHIVPYCEAAALIGSSQVGLTQNIEYIAISIIVMLIALHIHTIFLRLLLLRPRIFSSTLYVD